MPTDIPSPIDLRTLRDALAWEASALQKRPWRAEFFGRFQQAIADRPTGARRILELGSGPGFLAGSVARGCWCMYYRVSGKGPLTRPAERRASLRKQALKRLAAKDPPPGLVGYRGTTPVGWISLGRARTTPSSRRRR